MIPYVFLTFWMISPATMGMDQCQKKAMKFTTSMAIPGSDLLEVPTIYKAYFSGLNFRNIVQ